MNFNEQLKLKMLAFERCLPQFLPKGNGVLDRAIRYAVNAGGKRLRPVLVLEAVKIFALPIKKALPAACAIEFIHTYSLIHDDLPSMDNDDLRRGKPTLHKKFNEATAILAGDALLTDAFGLLASCAKSLPAKRVTKAIEVLSNAAGSNGMVFGQLKDTLEAGIWNKKNKAVLKTHLELIHKNKTAALLAASLVVGATLAGADQKQIYLLNNYGYKMGFAFQIADDVLDVVANKQLLGKSGSDAKNNKLTFVTLYGIDKSLLEAKKLVAQAKAEVSKLGSKVDFLMALADYIVDRKY